jgi:hypothetical protein
MTFPSNRTSELPLRGGRCLCGACGEFFNSTAAFDKHRVGPMTDRRCRSVAEMNDAGMAHNAAGYWITQPRFPT